MIRGVLCVAAAVSAVAAWTAPAGRPAFAIGAVVFGVAALAWRRPS